MINRRDVGRVIAREESQRTRHLEPSDRAIPEHLERQFHETMREHSSVLRRLLEMLYVPVCYTIPRGNIAANEQSLNANAQGIILYGVEATKIGGASELRVHAGSAISHPEITDINISAGDPQTGVLRWFPNGIDVENGIFSEIVAGTMRVNYIVARRAIAVNRSV